MSELHNENIELCVLASLFQDASLYSAVEDLLEKSDFGWASFGLIYKSFADVISKDIYPDVETIIADLDGKNILGSISIPSNGLRGEEVIRYIAGMAVNTQHVESYAYQVKQFRSKRQLHALSSLIEDMLANGKEIDDILQIIDVETGKISSYLGLKNRNTRNAKDVAQSNIQQFKDALAGKVIYIPTLIKAWEYFFGGIASRLYLIAARANEGKTAFVLNLIRNIAITQKIKVKLFTFESSAEEIQNKLVQIMTGIPTIRIEQGKLSPQELEKYTSALEQISQSPIAYDDSSEITLPLLRTKIRKAVADGANIIFIDQIEQLLIGGTGDSQPEYIRINYITYRLKAFQREMGVPIVAVHQLNRASESGENRNKVVDPRLGDLAQAGEKAPDGILMIRTTSEPAVFAVKNRQGRKGRYLINWVADRMLFEDMPSNNSDSSQQGQITLEEAFDGKENDNKQYNREE